MKSKRNRFNVVGSATARPGRVRLALGWLLALGLAVSARPAVAQVSMVDAGANRLPDKCYWGKSTLQLPVDIDPQSVANVKEIHFFVKDGPGKPWELLAKVPPTQKAFECKLPRDGEYWFNVVTIDHAGNASPADLSKEPPAVIVVLDTCDPQIDIKPLPPCSDGTCMKCEVRDTNPNPAQTKFEYQDGNKNWRALNSLPGQPDCFCIGHMAVWTGMVRVSGSDRANHTVSREFDFKDLAANAANHNKTAPQGTVTAVNYEPKTPPSPIADAMPTFNTEPVKTATNAGRPNELPIKAAPEMPAKVETSQPASSPKSATGKCLLVNEPRISLDYKIDDEGKSGIGKVEVWITKDNGKTWDVLCDDPDKKSPVVFDLPGEGVYGIRLSVTNGRGFGATPPKPGEVPEYYVELDMTKPIAELRSVKLEPANDCASIDIVWQASDKNLGSAPVELYYRSSPQDNWTPIQKDVANSGKYRWFPPQSIGREAYIRLVVTDAAGNTVRCDGTEAVALDDGTRPSVRIQGIGTVPNGAPAPSGN